MIKELLSTHFEVPETKVTHIDSNIYAVEFADRTERYMVLDTQLITAGMEELLKSQRASEYCFEPKFPILDYLRTETLVDVMEKNIKDFYRSTAHEPAVNYDIYDSRLTEVICDFHIDSIKHVYKNESGITSFPVDNKDLVETAVKEIYDYDMKEFENPRHCLSENYNVRWETNHISNVEFECLTDLLDTYNVTICNKYFHMKSLLDDLIGEELCNSDINIDKKIINLDPEFVAILI